jgi:ribosomal protein S18 acetylase RimI-like enzyme
MTAGELILRVATGADAPVLAALHESVHAVHVRTEPELYRAVDVDSMRAWFARELEAPNLRAELALDGGTALGYSLVRLREQPATLLMHARRILSVDQMGVAPHARRRGVGRALVRAIHEHARLTKAHGVELSVRAVNADAIAFYEALGFRCDSLRLAMAVS